MKKILVGGLMLLLAVGAFAQIDLTAGAGAGYELLRSSTVYDSDATGGKGSIRSTSNLLTFGLFTDATYARFDADFGLLVGEQSVQGTDNYDNIDDSVDNTLNKINLSLLGKYPFEVGPATAWAGAGLGYDIVTTYEDENGNDLLDAQDAWNDLYILVGAGADFEVAANVTVTPTLSFGYNLTPNPSDDDPPDGVSYRGWKLGVGVDVGYLLASF